MAQFESGAVENAGLRVLDCLPLPLRGQLFMGDV